MSTAKRKAPARKPGRPSSYSDKLAENILAQIIEGKSLRQICQAKGMPDRMTVLRWVEAHAGFAAKYARAREEQADTMDDLILETAGKTTSQNAAANRVKIDAYKWRAEKLKPKRYGSQMQHKHTGAVGTYDLSAVSDADLERLEQILGTAANAGGDSGGEGSPAG